MKKSYLFLLISIIIAVGIVTFLVSGKEGVHVPSVSSGKYVYDEADMINGEVESEINSIIVELEAATTAEVAVVSYEDSKMRLEEYATELFNKLGIGKADVNNGVLLLMQKQGNHVRLEVGKGINGVLTDSVAGDILDDYYVPYRDTDTSKAALETIKAVSEFIMDNYDGEKDAVAGQVVAEIDQRKNDLTFWGIMAAVVAVFIGSLALLNEVEKRNSRKTKYMLTGPAKDQYKGHDIPIYEPSQKRKNDNVYYDNYGSDGGSAGGFGGGSSDGGGASR